MAAVMFIGVFATMIADEPLQEEEPKSLRDAIINPFTEFFNRKGYNSAILILMFILLYKVGDTMAHSLSTNFYLDIGFTKSQIGTVVKIFGLVATLIGAFLGGLISLRIGLYKSLKFFGCPCFSKYLVDPYM